MYCPYCEEDIEDAIDHHNITDEGPVGVQNNFNCPHCNRTVYLRGRFEWVLAEVEIVEPVEVLLLHTGSTRKPVAPYSMEDHDGGVHGECCKECIPKAKAEGFTVVEFGKEESDILLFCNWCNVPLMMTPTEYCIERYLGRRQSKGFIDLGI